MDLLYNSDSESENELLEEVTKVKGTPAPDFTRISKRSSYRDKQLSKMFAIREILKWKYNYFEKNAHEHPLYQFFNNLPTIDRKSFTFKKIWRLRMDNEYDLDTNKIHRLFLEREIKKLDKKPIPKSGSNLDPARLLVEYDREVFAMIHRVRNEFNSYLIFPERYQLYEIEKKNFLIDHCLAAAVRNVTQINLNDIDKEFSKYWHSRVAYLCDLKISREKKQIQSNWRQLLPVYHDLGATSSENRGLLLSDIESDENF